MPDKINFLLTDFKEHAYHEAAITFHLAHHHFAHVDQIFYIKG